MTKPSILVIDDGLADEAAEREGFLARVGAGKRLGKEFEINSDFPVTFEFFSGRDGEGELSLAAVRDKVLEQWQAGRPRWALVLVDVHFTSRVGKKVSADETFGFKVVAMLRKELPDGEDLGVVVLTGFADPDRQRRNAANEAAADDFVPKGEFDSIALMRSLRLFGLVADMRPDDQRLVGGSLPMLRALRDARIFAYRPLGSRVIYGETGTGKTELARFIGAQCIDDQGRPKLRDVHSWTASPASDLTNRGELFGHWVGAFTGAECSEPGFFERAHGEIALIDEVADLTPANQTQLIEFRRRDAQGLRTITRLGNYPETEGELLGFKLKRQQQAFQSIRGIPVTTSGKAAKAASSVVAKIKVDVVLLFATNRPLQDSKWRENHGFREDLFLELGTPIHLPPLNLCLADQPDDIGVLFDHFLRRFLPANAKPVRLAPSTREVLLKRDWTDRNLVDLIRIAEYVACAFGSGFDWILPRHLPRDVQEEARNGRSQSPRSRLPDAATTAPHAP
jgi:DNA-binding NtrC family response regulator